MVRGCKKNVVYIKNTGSAVFKEAFFVVGDEEAAHAKGEEELVSEAHRIIEKKLRGEWSLGEEAGFFRKALLLIKKCWAPFLIGAGTATLIFALIIAF